MPLAARDLVLQFLGIAVLLLPLQLAWAGPQNASPRQLLRAVEVLEQTGISKSDPDRLTAVVDERMRRLSQVATEQFERETGLAVIDKPKTQGWSTKEMQIWISALRSRSQQQRCDLVRLAYAVALSRLSLMKASIPEPPSFPIRAEHRELPEFGQDVDRALWELRYFWILQDGSSIAPRNCMDESFPAFSIIHEASARAHFIEFGASSSKGVHFQRWPVGRAVQMCGRPFHTHYADHLIDEAPGRELHVEPISLQGVRDPEELRRRLILLEERALASD